MPSVVGASLSKSSARGESFPRKLRSETEPPGAAARRRRGAPSHPGLRALSSPLTPTGMTRSAGGVPGRTPAPGSSVRWGRQAAPRPGGGGVSFTSTGPGDISHSQNPLDLCALRHRAGRCVHVRCDYSLHSRAGSCHALLGEEAWIPGSHFLPVVFLTQGHVFLRYADLNVFEF